MGEVQIWGHPLPTVNLFIIRKQSCIPIDFNFTKINKTRSRVYFFKIEFDVNECISLYVYHKTSTQLCEQ